MTARRHESHRLRRALHLYIFVFYLLKLYAWLNSNVLIIIYTAAVPLFIISQIHNDIFPQNCNIMRSIQASSCSISLGCWVSLHSSHYTTNDKTRLRRVGLTKVKLDCTVCINVPFNSLRSSDAYMRIIHAISRSQGRALKCSLWGFGWKFTAL